VFLEILSCFDVVTNYKNLISRSKIVTSTHSEKIKIDKTEILHYFHALKLSISLIYDSCIFYIITFRFGV